MGKLYDACCFFNELDVLEIRLNELYDVVDYFIIHESTKSHTGKQKYLYFAENISRFDKFKDKIIYRCINDTPDYFIHLNLRDAKDELQGSVFDKINKETFWDKSHLPYSRDAYEKESLIRSMGGLENDDIVMFSDADEIPKASTIKLVKESFFDPTEIYNFAQSHFWFYLNCLRLDTWLGTTLLTFEKFKNSSVVNLRKYRQGRVIYDGGWHFSFMGGPNTVEQKIENYGEQSINKPYITNDTASFIESCISNKHDFYMNPCNFEIIPIDYSTHPAYLVENQNKFYKSIKGL